MRWARRQHLGLFSVTVAALIATCPPLADAQVSEAEQSYDIPRQPLTTALANFARVSGVDILYDSALARGRTSSPVRGTMSPQVALRILLNGTGLAARFTERRAAIVYVPAGEGPRTALEAAGVPSLRLDLAEVRAPATIGSPDRSGYQRYAQTAQLDIRRLLGEDRALKGRVFQLRMSLMVATTGRITSARLIKGSGDDARDSYIRDLLVGKMVTPPPEGFNDALYFEVATGRLDGGG